MRALSLFTLTALLLVPALSRSQANGAAYGSDASDVAHLFHLDQDLSALARQRCWHT